jgi:quercetin dioxygenase-like cupin family protein
MKTSGEAASGRLRRVWEVGRWIAGVLAAYLVVGNALHHWVFRMPPPDPATYPVAGDEFGSTHEGFHQRIVDVVDGWVVAELILEPGAVGPPLHYHKSFAEEFVVREGVLHIELADGIVEVSSGDSYRAEPGVAHRPFNPGNERVVLASEQPLFPQSFAACLVQIYPRLDAKGGMSLSLLAQMSVIDPICDTHPADIPRPALAVMKLVMAPAARLFGFRSYDPALALHPPS